MTPRARSAVALVMITTALVVSTPAAPAMAHPLGNFSVNHYNGLSLSNDHVDLVTIIDSAEIPTQQVLPSIDSDGDGELSGDELVADAEAQCAEVAASLSMQVGGAVVGLELDASTLETVPGAAGLPTLRLTCLQSAPADLGEPTVITFVDEYRPDRLGWHEITVVGDGVRLIDSPVATESISDELRDYPVDLLESPLDVRSVTMRTEPGIGGSTDSFDPGSGSSDPLTRVVAAGDRALQDLIGDRALTPLLGGLAVLLAMLLGAGHALLPGHGKTVMAAYLAGRRGSRRDAWLVGATVTTTHTASVLALGLLISLSAAVIGEQVLRGLGIVSGLLIAGVGLVLLVSALRTRRDAAPPDHHPHHEQEHEHEHDHDHDHEHDHEHVPALVHGAGDRHDHGTAHSHSHTFMGGHRHGPAGHTHDGPTGLAGREGRIGVVGMGLAGGLVPSPSALIVLLSAVAFGRTVFGVLLVLAYGLGMAGTLTTVGLLLVRFRDRIDQLGSTNRFGRRAASVAQALPLVTAVLVLVVGLGLVLRGVVLAG